MKKWFSILLLVISIAGTFCPCCMDDDCTAEITRQNSHAHRDHQDKGVCSPFFACGTCAASVVVMDSGLVLPFHPSVVIDHQSCYLLRLGRYAASLFQPPRYC